ncbi:GcrA cell cycle regulator [Roseiarcus fermentans]|uniref:GcrA cell cycle regulator n=1 Tax=Roseiarcus fermentans TaxID=1473586 RepID=A0A366FND6_9HYPH|nr:GcrA family cell cycle regulator [Roseiarcus fermentans]RBP16213.1 GcrA cell cycle regulator [Roseiarcus fermentans]
MWTEQTVETLRKFALEGRSAAWIAAALGAPSRSAVIGKANRIGIKLNGARSGLGGEDAPAPAPALCWGRAPPPARKPRPQAREDSVPRPRDRVPAVAREKRRAGRSAFAHAVVEEMRRIGLAEIGETECRWPLGDPGQDDFAYCGLPVARGRAYCAGHCRLIYRAPNP